MRLILDLTGPQVDRLLQAVENQEAISWTGDASDATAEADSALLEAVKEAVEKLG